MAMAVDGAGQNANVHYQLRKRLPKSTMTVDELANSFLNARVSSGKGSAFKAKKPRSGLTAQEKMELIEKLKKLGGKSVDMMPLVNFHGDEYHYVYYRDQVLSGRIPGPHQFYVFSEEKGGKDKEKIVDLLTCAIEQADVYQSRIEYAIALKKPVTEIKRLLELGAKVIGYSFVLAFEVESPLEVIEVLVASGIELSTGAYEEFFSSDYSAENKKAISKVLPFDRWKPTIEDLKSTFYFGNYQFAEFLFDHGAPISPDLFKEVLQRPELFKKFQERAEYLVAHQVETTSEERMDLAVAGCSDPTVFTMVENGFPVTSKTIQYGLESGRSEELIRVLLEKHPDLSRINISTAYSYTSIPFLEELRRHGIVISTDSLRQAINKVVPTDVVKVLLQAGNELNDNNFVSLAINASAWDILTVLIDAGLIINHMDDIQEAFNKVAPRELIQKMLECLGVKGRVIWGEPVHFALSKNFPLATAEKLISNGAPVYFRTFNSYGTEWICVDGYGNQVNKERAIAWLRSCVEAKIRNLLEEGHPLDVDQRQLALYSGIPIDLRRSIFERVLLYNDSFEVALLHFNSLKEPQPEEVEFIRWLYHRSPNLSLPRTYKDILEGTTVSLPFLQLCASLYKEFFDKSHVERLISLGYPNEMIEFVNLNRWDLE